MLNTLRPAHGATHTRKTVGRGRGSGHGGSSTRGGKGQTARSGWHKRPGFEGGQMPLLRRIPKRGFSHRRFADVFSIVNVGDLEARFEAGADVTAAKLHEAGLVRKPELPLKVLGDGTLTKKLAVKANAFSKSAEEKIKACGGTAEKI